MSRIVEIARENFPIYSKRILEIEKLSFKYPWSINVFKAEIEKPISHIWALITDETLVGYICYWTFNNEIQITNLAVHPLMRGQRLGQLILTRIIETGVSQGMKYIWLEVRPSNLVAKGLYDKLGFLEIGRSPRYYKETNEDAIIMALDLSLEGSYLPASN